MNRYGWLAVGVGVGLMIGGPSGFFVGVASTKFGQELVEGMVAVERPANVREPKTHTSKTMTFQYPGNWTLDTKDPDYDPDHSFSLNTPGSSSVIFYVFDQPLDAKETVEQQAEAYVQSMISRSTRQPFRRWGRYNGYGLELKGRVLQVNRGGVRIFSRSGESSTLQVVELYYDDDLRKVQPGFDLIRQTFQLKDRPAGGEKPR